MGKSFKIATFFNIPVFVHWSFGFLLLWVAYEGVSTGMSLINIGVFMLMILSLFLCVTLHEFGHALSARRYGVETRDIILSPIGGVARLSRLPEKPIQEFVVALAGPMVNVVIALVLGVLLFALGYDFESAIATLGQPNAENFWVYLLILNITLFLFNLVPAFPMDGGRMLRALLSLKFSRVMATKIASYLGQTIAVAAIAFFVYHGNFFNACIGIFIIVVARRELKSVQMEATLDDKVTKDFMRTEFGYLLEGNTWAHFYEIMENNKMPYFIFVDEQLHFKGIIQVKSLPTDNAPLGTLIADYYIENPLICSIDTPLKEVLHEMQDRDYYFVPVLDENEIVVGIMDSYILGELMKP